MNPIARGYSVCKTAREAGTPGFRSPTWSPTDKTFDDDKTAQLSYAESWLMVHYLMKSQQQLPKFRAYLAGLRTDEAASKSRRIRRKTSWIAQKPRSRARRYIKRVSR